jgi:amidase
VVDAHIARIHAVNPKINAVVQTCLERALNEARQADEKLAHGEAIGPLHGVPMTLKDSIDTADVITTAGTLGRINYIPKKDATVAARLRKAGAILLGKTNTPELTLVAGPFPGIFGTANIIYGLSRNPYDLSRNPAGSSGGAAAIIAAGGSPFDIGSDWGGSIRGPAHYTGIAAIKPTSGRVPRTGHIVDYGGVFDSWQQLGPMARYVEDLTLILPIIAGPDYRDAGVIPVPWRSPEDVSLPKLRVAFYTSNTIADPTKETKEAIHNVANVLEKAGGLVREDFPKDLILGMEEVRSQFTRADGWSFAARIASRWGSKTISPTLSELIKTSPVPTPQYTTLWERHDQLRSKLLLWIKNYDVVVCPVTVLPAQPIQSEVMRPRPGRTYTGVFNCTGWPVVVVRCGTSPEGLPIGLQIVGQPWREDVVLAVSRHLESEIGGWQKPAL